MISVEQALQGVIAAFSVLPAEQVPLNEALGRVLAEDVASRVTMPPADVSAMDGYAVRAADVAQVPATLTRIGESAAGRHFDGTVGPGQAVRIFTGAHVPSGADSIVIQENTTVENDRITILHEARPGRFIRRAGLDFAAGDVLLTTGTRLTARDVGLAAAMNVPWLMVRRKPRVAVLSTGNEVVMPGDPLGPDQIVSSNSVALEAYIRVLGGTPLNLGISRDSAESLRAMMAGAEGADLLVTIGGASVGDYDLVRQVLGDRGLDLTFYKVAMRPGKPLIFGRLGDTPVLGLPGNPVSAGVTSILFLRPAMAVMLGLSNDAGSMATAVLGRDLEANDERQDYLRASLTRDRQGDLVATPFEAQDSSMMQLFAQADCLAIRPPHAPPARAGDRIAIVPLQHGPLAI